MKRQVFPSIMSTLKGWLKNSNDGPDEYYVFTRLTEYINTKNGEKEIFHPAYTLQYDSPNGKIQSVDVCAVKILFFWILLPIELIQTSNRDIDWEKIRRIDLLSNILYVIYNCILAVLLFTAPWWIPLILAIPSMTYLAELLYPLNTSVLLCRIFHTILPNFYFCKVKSPD